MLRMLTCCTDTAVALLSLFVSLRNVGLCRVMRRGGFNCAPPCRIEMFKAAALRFAGCVVTSGVVLEQILF